MRGWLRSLPAPRAPAGRNLAGSGALVLLLIGCSAGGSGGSGSYAPLAPSGGGATDSLPAPQDQSTAVLVYGDSLWDRGDIPDRCDLCAHFPGDLQFTNYAAAGAEIWSQFVCDGLDEMGNDAPTDDPQCRNGVDRALPPPLHADPALDVCAAQVAGFPTCIRDNPDHEVLLLQFGTNDVRSAGVDDDALWVVRRADYEASLELILEERPVGMACVLVVPPPIWSEGFQVYNARLEELADIVYVAADLHDCKVADLFALYMEIEDVEGAGATLPLYGGCAAQGDPFGDCVHYSVPPPLLPADEIVDAIDRATGFAPPGA